MALSSLIGRATRRAVHGCALAFCAALSVAPAGAQTYPTKPIRIVVPYGPVGVVDLVPRLLAEKLSADLGQPVVVENKGGGLGIPAINDVLAAPADGHVIFAADAAHWAITPAMQKVPYDVQRDFMPISLTFSNGLVLFTGANSGINSVQDLIAQAKARPGQLNYATPGIGSAHHLALEVLRASLGLDYKHIPFKGMGEVNESIMRGDAHFAVSSATAVIPMAKAGKVKMLAVTIPTRLKQLPDLPTIGELTGLKDYSFPGQQGLMVKAGTPRAIVDRLSAAVRKAALAPDLYQKIFEGSGSEMTPTTPEQLTELIRNDIAKYTNAVKISGAQAQ